MKQLTAFEEMIITSICKQSEVIADHGSLHYKEVATVYHRLIDVQILALSGAIDTIQAIELLSEAKKCAEQSGLK